VSTYFYYTARTVIASALDSLGDTTGAVKGVVTAAVDQKYADFIPNVPLDATDAARAGWKAARTDLLAERFPAWFGKATKEPTLF
jgi:hypothetical protein